MKQQVLANRPICGSLLLLCSLPTITGYVMTDSNIRMAVSEWLSDATAAEAKYGHISTWKTGRVTDMSYLFCARRSEIIYTNCIVSTTVYGCTCAETYTWRGNTYSGCSTVDYHQPWCGTSSSDCALSLRIAPPVSGIPCGCPGFATIICSASFLEMFRWWTIWLCWSCWSCWSCW